MEFLESWDSTEANLNGTEKGMRQSIKRETAPTNCCHVIPAVDEASVEDEVIGCLPLANQGNVSFQVLAHGGGPANQEPEHHQENHGQHPHDPAAGHVRNPLCGSREEHLQYPAEVEDHRYEC